MAERGAEFDVVMLGGDIGVYALARAFHEAFGVRSTAISRTVAGPIADSSIVINEPVGGEGTEEQLLARLVKVAEEKKRESPETPLIALANADWLIELLSDHRDELSQWYVLPILSAEVLESVSDKTEFTHTCERLAIPTPGTVTIDFRPGHRADGTPPTIPAFDFDYPVVAKTSRSSAYAHVEFEGKRKVFKIESRAELEDLVRKLDDAGYTDRFVVQEMIPGDDTAMRSITAYVDATGTVTMLGGAHVLLEEHTPGAMGNPAAMFTTDLGELYDHALAFLEESGYRGFANFDVKVDPRDGVGKFFEVNPRIGRNNYYMTAAGINVAEVVVSDAIRRQHIPLRRLTAEVLYSVVPKPLLWRYITEPQLKARVKAIGKKATVHPLAYEVEGLGRKKYVALAMINQVKKFLTYYPKPSTTGF